MKRNNVTPRTLINAAIQESLPLLPEDKKAEKGATHSAENGFDGQWV